MSSELIEELNSRMALSLSHAPLSIYYLFYVYSNRTELARIGKTVKQLEFERDEAMQVRSTLSFS